LDENEETYIDLFRGAVKGLVNVEWIKLTVSGKEYGMACRDAEGLKSLVNGAKHIEISVDRDAPAGTCLIETPQGIIDAGMETQLGKVNEMMDHIRMAERGEDSAF
jgi:flagellar assembly protein FliH